MYDLNSFYIFVKVIQRGGFSAASEHTGIPVATVSRRINELEKQVGLRLIERSTRRIRLTEAGQVIYDFAKRGVEEFEAGRLALEERETEVKGKLRISMPPTFDPWFALISDFQKQFPNIEIDAFVTSRKVDMIEDGIDVAVRIGSLIHQSAVAREVFRYRHVLVATPEYIAAFGKPKTPTDLVNFPCGVWHQNQEQRAWNVGGETVCLRGRITVNDYLHLQYAALRHEIITELPPFFCRDLIEQGRFVEVLPDFPFPEQTISLVYPSRKQISRICRTYIDFCVENASKYLKK